MQSFKELIVWQKSFKLCVDIYKLTETFPKNEIYGLSSQIRRASVSIPSNIAEGFRRNTTKEYIQFIHIALGSTGELETQILLAKELLYFDKAQYDIFENNITEIVKMLVKLIKSLQEKLE